MLQEDIQEKMKNSEFKRAWHGLDAEFQILEDLLREKEETKDNQSKFTERMEIHGSSGSNNRARY
ncbi:MAG: hypothetical protein HQL05_05990 [Nitrospirae bacterium]|uniref:hypothetical protein n=1 Tax=Candidatus Magnetobacterium casense TaxID=1455061 RepID=UPI0012DD7E7D|nr:hypothetical protein [Candidatus Magnetobacterium casensis]MBF0337365.1 hypothetical protein [Nitrospirota bacterium]